MWVLVVVTVIGNTMVGEPLFLNAVNESDCKKSVLIVDAISTEFLRNQDKKLIAACVRMS